MDIQQIKESLESYGKETLILMGLGILIVLLLLFILNYVIRNYRQNATRRKDILNSIYQTEDRERERIAKELHDNLGALLSTIKLQAGTLNHLETIDEIHMMTNDINGLVDNTIIELRAIIRNIIPSNMSKDGWIGEIQKMTQKIQRTGSLNIQFTSTVERRYRPDVEINLYRVLQELLNNVMKHSKASTVKISILDNKENLYIRFEDDGIGFDIDDQNYGMGRKSIESRINLYNGKLQVKSERYLGTMYDIIFLSKDLI